jgi:outer membrane protein
MSKNRTLIIVIILFSISIGFSTWTKYSTPKIAYVRSADLVDKYMGMMEAKNIYKDKMAQWKSNVDTLQNDYQRSVSKYNLEVSGLSKVQRSEREELLKKQEYNIRQYMSALDQKAQEEDDRMTQGVLNQINSYVKEYGEGKGYDVILGLTLHGNVLYGKEAIDITDEVLKGLNDSFKNSTIQK